MNALSLKGDILKSSWVGAFHVIIHLENSDWYHCHDDEEVPAGSEVSLKAQVGLPIPTFPPVPYPHFVRAMK